MLFKLYRLENSILPSISVGTPLQVAGRYLQVRTVCNTRRSPAMPALSRISGLCTRPSVPMMKLTLTLWPCAAEVNSGSGVVRASGGWTSSQAGRELTWVTSTNWEARASVLDTRLSRCSKVSDRRRGAGVVAATATTGIINHRIAGQVRRCMNLVPLGLFAFEWANVGPFAVLSISLLWNMLQAQSGGADISW